MRQADFLPAGGPPPASASPDSVVGRPERSGAEDPAPPGSRPATECTVVTSSASSKLDCEARPQGAATPAGGSCPHLAGQRKAGYDRRRLRLRARAASACPCTSARSGSSASTLIGWADGSGRRQSGIVGAATASVSVSTGRHVEAGHHRGFRRVRGRDEQSRISRPSAPSSRDRQDATRRMRVESVEERQLPEHEHYQE